MNTIQRLTNEKWEKLETEVKAPRGPIKIPMKYFNNNHWNRLSVDSLKDEGEFDHVT